MKHRLKTRPYKAYAAIAVVMLGTLLADATLPLPIWVKAALVSLVAGLTVFQTANPAIDTAPTEEVVTPDADYWN